jgi:alpha-D-ribose 1-methylphosphonate 5-triphosphate synthase subunit PhnG
MAGQFVLCKVRDIDTTDQNPDLRAIADNGYFYTVIALNALNLVQLHRPIYCAQHSPPDSQRRLQLSDNQPMVVEFFTMVRGTDTPGPVHERNPSHL